MADSQKYTSPVSTDYQEVEYIQSSGNGEYIDTGYVPTVNTKFNIDFQFIEATTPYYESIPIMGERSATAPNSKVGLWINKTSFKEALNFGSYDSSYSTTDITNANVRNVTSNIKANMYYNGVFVRGDNNAEFTTGDLSIYLFAINSSGTPDNRNCVVKLYRYKLYENDVLVRDFVPVYRKSDNVAGLYDTINDVFYTNQGTGSFTVGSNVSPWQHSLRKLTTATDTFTTLPADIYADGTNASVGLKGNMYQASGVSPDTPIQPQETGERTRNLFDITAFVQGISPNRCTTSYDDTTNTLTINATGNDAHTGNTNSYHIPVTGGETYTLSWGTNAVSGQMYIFENGLTDSSHLHDWNSSLRRISITMRSDTTFIIVRLGCSAANTVKTYSDIRLNSGSTALPYKPYGYKLDISSGGKNLFDYVSYFDSVFTPYNEFFNFSSIQLLPNTTYTLSTSIAEYGISPRNTPFIVATTNQAPTTAAGGISNISPVTITTENDGILKLYKRISGSGIQPTKDLFDDGDWLMLNLGSTPLPYEPYNRTTTPIYLGEVQTTRRVKKLVLTGNESFIVRSGEPSNTFFYEVSNTNFINNQAICSHYINQNSGSFDVLEDKHCLIRIGASGDKTYIGLRDSTFPQTNEGAVQLRTWLSAQYAAGTPVTIWYVLATEETGVVNEPIRKIGDYADTVSGITIPTISGKDTFDVETTLKPSEVELTYAGWHDATVKLWDGSQWQ